MTDKLIHHALVFGIDVVRLTVWLVLLSCIFVPLERLLTLRPAKIWRPQVGVDLGWYFINNLVPAAIMAFPLAFMARAIHGINPVGLYTTVGQWPFWVKLPLAMLVSDFGAYWAHRAFHAFPWLWRFHAVHHSAEHMDWLVNTRVHPVDIIFTRLCAIIPIYLFGLAEVTGRHTYQLALIVTVIGTVWTYFIHSNIRCRLGPLEWVVSSPAFHHWHHTNDEHRDRNFAALFPVFDRIFGTAWLPKSWPPVYGIDAKMPPTLHGQLLDPLSRQQTMEAPGESKEPLPLA